MGQVLHGVIVSIVLLAALAGGLSAIRWARRGGAGVGLAASALLLALGMGLVVTPPQEGVAQAEEEKDKTGGESGDPL